MADRPILFSAPMIRALLDGRKTQTRRVLNRARVFATPETPSFTLTGADMARALQNADRFRHLDGDGWFWEADAFEWQAPAKRTGWMAHIGYGPGDRLWVRESLVAASTDQGKRWLSYAADGKGVWPITEWHKPRTSIPSIHMPRWASRLTLIVTDVRVQRLQEISEEDAKAEGCIPDDSSLNPNNIGPARQIFRNLWDSLNASRGYSWEANPWVVAVSFDVIKQNFDQIGRAA